MKWQFSRFYSCICWGFTLFYLLFLITYEKKGWYCDIWIKNEIYKPFLGWTLMAFFPSHSFFLPQPSLPHTPPPLQILPSIPSTLTSTEEWISSSLIHLYINPLHSIIPLHPSRSTKLTLNSLNAFTTGFDVCRSCITDNSFSLYLLSFPPLISATGSAKGNRREQSNVEKEEIIEIVWRASGMREPRPLCHNNREPTKTKPQENLWNRACYGKRESYEWHQNKRL